MNHLTVLLLCFCCLAAQSLSGQHISVRGAVVNGSSGQPIGFASISWKKGGNGMLTDSTGHFRMLSEFNQDTLLISHVGFASLAIPIDVNKDTAALTIELSPKVNEGVVIVAKYNKGLWWWKRIVLHKPKNNPYKSKAYSCSLYKKLELDLDNVNKASLARNRLVKPFGFILDNIDSTSGNKPFLPIYLTESISRYYHSAQPFKKREEIIAVQTNGIKNESALHFVNGFSQQVNVYENYITLFGKEFISPLSTAGDAYYTYKAADTLYAGAKRYYHLLFSPKRQGENTFSGDCWIEAGSWAIQKINLEVSSTANINYVNRLSIMQEFVQQQDSTWIFAKDKFIAGISPVKNKLSLLVQQTILYRDVVTNQPAVSAALAKNTETDQVVREDSADARTAVYWQSNRPEALNANERKVYTMIDTLRNMPLFRTYTNTFYFIVDGRKDLGYVEIGPWYKWLSGNQLEKVRTRFDLATTKKFSEYLYAHTYLAYGFADKALKGKLEATYTFPGRSGYSVHAAYVKDLDNGTSLNNDEEVTTDNMFSQLIRKPGIKQKFILIDEIRTAVAKEWPWKCSAQVSFSHTGYKTFDPLPSVKQISVNQENIINTELGVRLRYAPGEKVMNTHRRNRRIPGEHPVFEIRYAQGLRGLAGGAYNYQRLSVHIDQLVAIPRWGKVQYRLYGGQVWGNPLPFMLLELHPGNETYYYSKRAFNLINRFEYFSDRYAGFSIEHDFEKKLLNLLPFARKINIRQFWNLKAVWGDLSNETMKLNQMGPTGYNIQSLHGRPYIELGTGLDNILTCFRVDLVWRITPSPITSPGMVTGTRQNAASPFGVFGSFHFQF